MATRARKSAVERLADAVGIVPKYLDQTGKEWRETSDESRVALLAAMGFEASSQKAADAALRQLRAEERRELIAPVRVVEVSDSAARHLPIRLGSAPNADARWQVELTLESGESFTAEGGRALSSRGAERKRSSLPLSSRGAERKRRDEGSALATSGKCRSLASLGMTREASPGMTGELPIPWPADPVLGYHSVTVSLSSRGREQRSEQTLIIVPSRCVLPGELIPNGRAFGLIANLYTVRSDRNWGVGDLTDLRELIEWAGELGAAFVGVNPLHALANRGGDISPYSPISRVFRNPLYLDVDAIPELRLVPNVAARLDRPEFEAELDVLREDQYVRYEEVMSLKVPVLEELHRVFAQSAERDAQSARAKAYEAYLRAQDPELTRFATFVAIAEAHKAWSWREWPRPLQSADSDAVRQFQHDHAERIDLHRWIQFELDRQLGEVAKTARSDGLPIGVYQDLAIGTSPTGADSWAMPELFVQRASIGAPPDPYSASGQNWGLPPIDPRALRRDRYRYFIRLVQSGFRHAGALRIDHAMGLFRLFWIPEGKTGREGAYVRYPAADLLGILALESVRHNALVVGEDLGTVPKEVPPALEKWGVLSSKVLYFEREKRGGFRAADRYEPLALATANTHDMATLEGFWEGRDIEQRARVGLIDGEAALEEARGEREKDKRTLLTRLARDGVLPGAEVPNDSSVLRGAIHEFLCRTPAALVGLALDDLVGEVEAVNLPGVGPDQHPSWKRKMSMTIDEMRFSAEVRTALGCAERGAGGALSAGRGTRDAGGGGR